MHCLVSLRCGMAKICGGDQFVGRLILAVLFLNVVTAQQRIDPLNDLRIDKRIDVPNNEFSSYIDQLEQLNFGTNYPVVTVELLPSNQLRATQRRFPIDQPGDSDTEYTWNISLGFLTKGGNNGRMWLNKTEDVFDIPLNSTDDWIVFNVDGSRQCRVKYDDVLWNRITKQLKENHTELPENVRSRLFMDARNLAKVGLLGYDKVLGLISYASNDRYMPLWYHIYDFINFFRRMIYDTTSSFHFQRFMLDVTSSVRDEMTFMAPRDVFEAVIHPLIWSMSCSFGHKDCIEKTMRIFRERIESTSPIYNYTVGYRDVSCIGLENSLLESDWNTIFERYVILADMKLQEQRLDLLHGLSCSRNFTLLERLLERTLENPLKSARDFYHFRNAMESIDSRPPSNYTAWKWLRLNHAKVDERMKPRSSMDFLKELAYNLKTREQRQEVLDFFDNYPNADPNDKSRILDIIDRNIRWRERNLAIIAQWFKENAPY